MIGFVIRRLLYMIPTVIIISMVSFLIIEAPPGDYVSVYVAQLETMGEAIDMETIEGLRARYGVDQPIYVKYFKWVYNMAHGDLGISMEWNDSVNNILKERLPWSIAVSGVAFLFVYTIGIIIGVISATRQYSICDYTFTTVAFIGLAIPPFLSALVVLWLYFIFKGEVALGLFSPQYQMAPWSFAKFINLLDHIWIPGLIVGLAETAGLIRMVRANLLDELHKPYVMVARTKGLSERKLLYKYPFRIAVNPIASTVGWTLPKLVNGELLTALVLGLPTLAPIFLSSLLSQDMFLAGSIVFILSILTILGTLLSDILLAWLDPRIREAV